MHNGHRIVPLDGSEKRQCSTAICVRPAVYKSFYPSTHPRGIWRYHCVRCGRVFMNQYDVELELQPAGRPGYWQYQGVRREEKRENGRDEKKHGDIRRLY